MLSVDKVLTKLHFTFPRTRYLADHVSWHLAVRDTGRGRGTDRDVTYSAVKGEAGSVLEDGVRGEEAGADVQRRGCDPKVTGVASVLQRVTALPACVPQFGDGGEQGVADGNDGSRLDRCLKAPPPRLAPPGHQGAVSELTDRGSGRKIW